LKDFRLVVSNRKSSQRLPGEKCSGEFFLCELSFLRKKRKWGAEKKKVESAEKKKVESPLQQKKKVGEPFMLNLYDKTAKRLFVPKFKTTFAIVKKLEKLRPYLIPL